jgi:Spy/CpxP family protein refolding chaperone
MSCRMSRRSFAAALLAPALLLALAAVAQSRGDAPPDRMADRMDHRPPPRGEAGGRPSGPPPGPPVEELRRTLSLDDRQAQAVAKILDAHRAQVEQLHARTRAEHDALATATDAQLRKVLDARQFAAFQTWKQTHRPPPPPPFDREGDRRGERQGDRRPPMGPPPAGPQEEG